jgi:hypothetical protein
MGGLREGNDSRRVAFSSAFDPGRSPLQPRHTVCRKGSSPDLRLVKSVAEGLAQIENAEDLKPVLVNIEDGWQIGYLLETLQKGWVTVFLPQAPTPMSGNVMYLPAERVRMLATRWWKLCQS